MKNLIDKIDEIKNKKEDDKSNFVSLLLSYSYISCSYSRSREILPIYNLSVSFDLKNNLLKGTARITFQEDGERNISVGELNIISIKFNGQRLEPVLKDGILKSEVRAYWK